MANIQNYYKFHNDFVMTVFKKFKTPTNFMFFDVCPFYHVKYEVDPKTKLNYYQKCFLKYKSEGGLIPQKQLF